MPIPKSISSALVGITLILASCAPKATVVKEEPVAPVKKETKQPEPSVPEPLPVLPDDGLRMGNGLLEMPKDGDFRATNPSTPKVDGQGGSVISRPPTEPPSRVKPKEPASE